MLKEIVLLRCVLYHSHIRLLCFYFMFMFLGSMYLLSLSVCHIAFTRYQIVEILDVFSFVSPNIFVLWS